MANRQQDYQSASRQGRYRSDENDDTSRYSRDNDRDYGRYRDTDEGDSPAGVRPGAITVNGIAILSRAYAELRRVWRVAA